jgi:hypothetical protein
LRQRSGRIDRRSLRGHQRAAEALTLPSGQDRHQADHDQRVRAALRRGQRRPASLDGADEGVRSIERGEAQCGSQSVPSRIA